MANIKRFDKEKKFPLRLEDLNYEQLKIISKFEGSAINDVINVAIKKYISTTIRQYDEEGKIKIVEKLKNLQEKLEMKMGELNE